MHKSWCVLESQLLEFVQTVMQFSLPGLTWIYCWYLIAELREDETCIKITKLQKAVTNPEAGNSWSLFYTWHHFIVDFLSSERMVFCLTCFFQTLVFSFLSWFDAERMNLLQILGTGGAWALQAVKERGRRSKGAAQACLQDKWKWHKTGTKKVFCYDSVKILRRKVQKMKC